MEGGRAKKCDRRGKHKNLKRKVVTVKRKGALFWTLRMDLRRKSKKSILNLVQEVGSGGVGEGTSVESAGVDAGGRV